MAIKEEVLVDRVDNIFEQYFKINKSILSDLRSNHDDLNELIIDNFNRLDQKNITYLSDLSEEILSGLQYRDLDKIDQTFLLKGKHLKVMDITEEKKKIDIESDFDKRILKTNDILFRIKGKIGPGVVITEDMKDMYYYNDIARVRVNTDQVIPQYLCLYLNSFIGKYYLDKIKQSKSMTYIKLSSFKNLPVLTPLVQDQWKVVQKFHVQKNILEVMENN